MTPETSSTFHRAVDHAFAGRLSAATRLLDASPNNDDVLWGRAYLFAATGSFERAEPIARSLIAVSRDAGARARAAVTLGSILRQTGRHEEAGAIEAEAIRRTRDPELRAHLRIGLAADAVGLGDLAGADRELSQVPPGRALGWRVAVRLRWVRCEREMLAGRAAQAARWARSSLAIAERAGARRHTAKSLLFLGAASTEIAARGIGIRRERAAAEAARSLKRAASIAARIGARPIERVANRLLGRARLG